MCCYVYFVQKLTSLLVWYCWWEFCNFVFCCCWEWLQVSVLIHSPTRPSIACQTKHNRATKHKTTDGILINRQKPKHCLWYIWCSHFFMSSARTPGVLFVTLHHRKIICFSFGKVALHISNLLWLRFTYSDMKPISTCWMECFLSFDWWFYLDKVTIKIVINRWDVDRPPE